MAVPRIKNQNGFTLAELLVVLGIIVLISLITIPLLSRYQKTTKLKSEARVLVTNLRLTQQYAITEQIIYKLKFFPQTKSYELINTKTNTTIKNITMDDEITISQISDLTDNSVQFNPTGAALESGTIYLTNTQHSTSTIQVKPSGFIDITD
ncbi:MAG: GspH/FimT family pseudopilin [Candidatus Buchananbacteria bacterium]